MIGLGFAVRANIAPNLQAEIYDKIDLANSAAMVGAALGATFTGFALTLLFGSALVDLIGMKRMLLLVCAGLHRRVSRACWWRRRCRSSATVANVILVSLLLTGLGWGAVEAASNPMVAALYPEEKTHRLNILHAWWPAGIVVGGLLGVAITALGLPVGVEHAGADAACSGAGVDGGDLDLSRSPSASPPVSATATCWLNCSSARCSGCSGSACS